MTIADAVTALGPGPLTEPSLREHIAPLFSRVLAGERERNEIYLANHSLGRPLDRTADDVAHALDVWYRDMDAAWDAWLDEITTFRANSAQLIGHARPDAVVPKTAAGQGLRAVLNALPGPRPNIVATTGEFDSINFILKTYAHKARADVSWIRPDDAGLFHAESIAGAITVDTDLVVLSMVVFATGQLVTGIEHVIDAAHTHDALVLLDTYHAAGAIPVAFDELGADFAVGGSYKYTRGGPGACWLAIADRHLRTVGAPPQRGLFTLDTGWFAKHDTFSYRRADNPELSAGGDAWLESTPPFLLPYQAKAGLELTLAIGVDRLHEHNKQQQARLADAFRSRGVEPRLIEPRGAFLLIPHPDAQAISQQLKQAGVNTDARPCPGGTTAHVRLCPDILTTNDELDRAAQILVRVLANFG